MLPSDAKVISVDDHVVEPPHVWQEYLPAKYVDRGPRVIDTVPGRQAWLFEDTLSPVGFGGNAGTRSLPTRSDPDGLEFKSPEELAGDDLWVHHFDKIPFAAYEVNARVEAMDADGIWAQLLFPQFPRFAGTRFLGTPDKDFALACVQAYNNWMLDEWCAAQPERFIPQVITPLWDVDLAAKEIERCAAKGAKSVAFTENPAALGLASFPSGAWDPVFAVAEETGLVLSMHIGSSGTLPRPSKDALFTVGVALCGLNSMMACTDLIFSGALVNRPGVKIALSEGGAGWAPYLIERMDYTWQRSRYEGVNHDMPAPSELFRRHFWVCAISDDTAIKARYDIGVDKLMFESDFPHNDSNFPNSHKVFSDMLAGVPDDEARQIAELNARRLYDFWA
jgi:predicted TIM-barrel fold metal-dependent hydrolase